MRTKYISAKSALEARVATEKRLVRKQYTKFEDRLAKVGCVLVFGGFALLLAAFTYGDFVSRSSAYSNFYKEKLAWVGHIIIPAIIVGLISVGGLLIWLAGYKRQRRLSRYDD